MGRDTTTVENALGLNTTKASLYLTSPAQLKLHPELALVAFSIRHAWSILELDGVLVIDNQPAAYLKESRTSFPKNEVEGWIKFLWNHGTAPLLILMEPTNITVHSSMTRPPADEGITWSGTSLVDTWNIVAETMEQNSLSGYLRKIETGEIYRSHKEKFDTENAVDKCLMENLHHLRNGLGFTDPELAHNLLGRILFISFLCDRKFLKARHFPDDTTDLKSFFSAHRGKGKRGIKILYETLFPILQKEFNGSMFTPEMGAEREEITPADFDLIADFLNREEIESGQMTLPFSVYDFSHIPVETISAIYEDFLDAEDSGEKQELGAFYTPRHLAEMVLGIATEGGKNVGDWKFLDPSCGSGVFLVIAFNLLAEHWQFHQGNEKRKKPTRINALLNILLNQIRGVDVEPTACRIAAFSLYLALFEKVQPVELDEFKASLKGKPILPNLLSPTPANRDGVATVSCMDFVRKGSDLPEDFDCVIGNPPWGKRGKKQIAFPFVTAAPERIKQTGRVCFVLPTTMLVGEQGTMDKTWFVGNKVDSVINLADFQNQLFVGPDYPCFVIRYGSGDAGENHSIRYLTPSANSYDNRRGLIPLEAGDEKHVTYDEIRNCKTNAAFRLLWVSRFRASERDLKFLQRLWMMPQLADSMIENGGEKPPLIKGVGFKPFYTGETKDTQSDLPKKWRKDPYLETLRDDELVILANDCYRQNVGDFLAKHTSRKGTPASTEVLRRRPDERIFHAPIVLHNVGFTKFAFYGDSGNPVRFQHSVHSIASQTGDYRAIALLTAFLQSSLAKYLIYFSAAGWIAGRNQIHMEDKMHLPFPLPGSPYAVRNSQKLADEMLEALEDLSAKKAKLKELLDPEITRQARYRLNELVFQYYGVGKQERILVEDLCEILEPSSRPGAKKTKGKALLPPNDERKEIQVYAATLCKSLNDFSARFGSCGHVEFEASLKPRKSSRLRFVALKFIPADEAAKSKGKAEASVDFSAALSRMEEAVIRDDTPFQYLRGFKYLEKDDILILKPDILRHWTRTAALNDADEIIGHLVGDNTKSRK